MHGGRRNFFICGESGGVLTLEAHTLVRHATDAAAQLVERRSLRTGRALRANRTDATNDTLGTPRARRALGPGNTLGALLARRTSDALNARRTCDARSTRLARKTVAAGLARHTRGARGARASSQLGDDSLVLATLLEELVLHLLHSLLHAVPVVRDHVILLLHEIVSLLVLLLDLLNHALPKPHTTISELDRIGTRR